MSDRIFASTTAATGTDGAVAQAVRAALCHLPGVDEAGSAHLVGLASDMAIMSLLALSAYLMLLVGRVSFGQQAFFGVGAYGAGVMTALFNVPLPLALLVGMALGAACSWLLALPTMRLSGAAREHLARMVPPGHEPAIHVSLTDDPPMAQAIVIISAVPVPPPGA